MTDLSSDQLGDSGTHFGPIDPRSLWGKAELRIAQRHGSCSSRGMEKHSPLDSPPPSSEQARERHADLTRNLERIVALRDDLRVRARLLSMDLKEEWDKKVSPVFFELEEKAKDVLRHLEAFAHRAKEPPPPSSRH